MAELAGKSVLIKISGSPTTMTGEATTSLGDNKAYQITNTAKQVVDFASALTVLEGGVATTDPYTFNYLNGTVTFDSADAGRGVITITGKYLPMTTAAYANSVSRSEVATLGDATVFQDEYRRRTPLLLSASGTLTQIDVTDSTFLNALLAGNPVVIEDRDTATSEPNRFRVLLETSELSAAIEDLQKNVVSWTSTDEWIKQGG